MITLEFSGSNRGIRRECSNQTGRDVCVRRAMKYFFGVFLFLISAQTKGARFSVSEISSAEQGVFKILTGIGSFQGTGFPIEDSERIYIVTNLHVLFSAKSEQDILIENEHQGSLKIKRVAASTEIDLALIEVDDYKGPVFKLADFGQDDNSGYLMGFPNAQFKTTEVWGIHPLQLATLFKRPAGCDDKPNGILGSFDMINVSIPGGQILKGERNGVAPLNGNSGGPLLNRKKEALGVLFYSHCQELYFIDSRQIKDLLKEQSF